jgi:cell division protein FtsI/penicillin-binding protein 2
MELRIRIISIGFIIAVLVISGRLFFWQVVKGQELKREGRAQQQSASSIMAQRGDILASDGTWLAASTDAWRLVAERPRFTAEPRDTARKLSELFAAEIEFRVTDPEESEDATESAKIKEDLPTVEELRDQYLEDEEDRLYELLSNNELVWIPLKQKVSRQLREKIDSLGIEGFVYEDQETRTYPEASSAAHLLGFVGKDDNGNDKGYFGIEGYYDSSLAGKNGFVSRESNALGAPIIFGDNKESSAISGVNLRTHIDKTIQIIAEKHLKEGLEKYGALSGSIIVSRPEDGAILAMASWPSYDPDDYYDYGDEFFRNPVISDGFEPGSIFKPIVMAAGLDAGVVKPDTHCDICGAPYKVDKYYIKTWNNEYSPNTNMTDTIIHSDNVGMSFVGNKLGADRLYDYLVAFGFGQITGIDLQGEVTPSLREKGTWNIVDLATTTFGQGIAVTPIQMVNALNIIANDGVATTLQVVDKIEVADSAEDIKPQIGKQVISKEAAAEITQMMILAVKEGEAKWAVPEGFTVAGKTGTAQIPVSGHYDDEKTIASFVGFAPPSNPKFLMLITLREPQSSPWASETAAPLWFDIAKEIFPYLGIQPGS